MKRKGKIISVLLLSAALLFTLFSGCGKEKTQSNEFSEVLAQEMKNPVTLHVVSEYVADRDNSPPDFSEIAKSLRNIVDYYNAEHENVTVELEFLPYYSQPRETRLQSLRTEIMAGKGPDLYLLPTGDLKGEDGDMPHLFRNVEQAMRSNLFLDLSSYYGSDVDLKTEELQQSIMDAGVLNGKRYVLPLGFNTSMLTANIKKCQALGIDLDRIENEGILALYDEAEKAGTLPVSFNAYLPAYTMCNMTMFPHLFDYDSGSVLLTEQEVEEIMGKTNYFFESQGDYSPEPFSSTVGIYKMFHYPFIFETEQAFSAEKLSGLAETMGLSKYLDIDLAVFPLRATDGSLVANVSYWGAVNANCQAPAAAYDFLRLFLTPEVQLGQGFGSGFKTKLRDVTRTCGWPVRTKDSLQTMWNAVCGSGAGFEGVDKEVELSIVNTDLSSEELPVLSAAFDEVRFPGEEYLLFNTTLQELEESGFSEENMKAAAKELLTQLKYYIAES